MKTLFKYYGPAILWALFILIMCTIKLGSINESVTFFPGFDKLAHCGFFFVLVVLWCNGSIRKQNMHRIPYKPLIIILIISTLFGGLIELLQLKVFTWRDGDWADFFADAVGASMGAFGIWLTVKTLSDVKK
jgi:VanZ family protein